MLTKEIQKDLQEYLDEHAKMQFICYNLSTNADRLGYPGFAHYYQVQAQDEVLHQRRIMNFMMDRDGTFEMTKVEPVFKELKSIKEVVEEYAHHRKHFAEITNHFAAKSRELGDLVTNKFYDWFIIDFYEELAEVKDILDWINMSNGNYYKLDRKMGKREEPDTKTVIDPFSPHN